MLTFALWTKVLADSELLELCTQLCPSPEERDKLLTFDGEEAAKLREIEKTILPFANVTEALGAERRVLAQR